MSSLADQIPAYLPAWRRFKDRAATATISGGGASVLVAILLIFFYLIYEVLPLFTGASLEPRAQFAMAQGVQSEYVAIEEQGELAMSVGNDNVVRFFQTEDGAIRDSVELPGSGGTLAVVAQDSPESRLLALGYADGTVRLMRHQYRITYPNDQRLITPAVEFPNGDAAFTLSDQAITALAVRDAEEGLVLVSLHDNGELHGLRITRDENFLTGEVEITEESLSLPAGGNTVSVYVGSSQRWLYLLGDDGSYRVVDLKHRGADIVLPVVDRGQLFEGRGNLSASALLLGGISVLAASDEGELAQYFMVQGEAGPRLQRIREFDTDGETVTALIAEHRRKGFAALGQQGRIQLFHTTAHRRVLDEQLDFSLPVEPHSALSPRGNQLLLQQSNGDYRGVALDNKHPDISWSALWDKVWYESYPEPDYIWQSSASNNDFEPKYSFSPLAFGTLKAAFYAMLIAAPLAICGAIYTAYFMAPALRRKIKPLIELMEALPTVILGFLAGLWLAPFIEDKLTGVVIILLVMPVGVLLFAFAWSRLPVNLRTQVPDGWHAALLIPVVLFLGWFSFAISDAVELWLFGGDMRVWVTNDLGISFDQRNALVVGIAMGMAVIPTIFSIAEDAIFSVPKHLSFGSLALGATPWQTLVGVVLPTASPGIFSALMIGMGRAVGETMIVLMATGNTPIMDINIFEGMRTLAANIAVEVPEAEVDSTHYRVLFLAAFVLFLFTFVVNTLAELIRQRLRIKYGSL